MERRRHNIVEHPISAKKPLAKPRQVDDCKYPISLRTTKIRLDRRSAPPKTPTEGVQP